jgi:hypothetical protein
VTKESHLEVEHAIFNLRLAVLLAFQRVHDPEFDNPAAVVAALIRLGRKYDFRDVLDSAVERITFENPKTLEEFDALCVEGKYKSTRIVPQPGLVFDILKLARENDIVSALPVAYYRAAQYHLVRALRR